MLSILCLGDRRFSLFHFTNSLWKIILSQLLSRVLGCFLCLSKSIVLGLLSLGLLSFGLLSFLGLLTFRLLCLLLFQGISNILLAFLQFLHQSGWFLQFRKGFIKKFLCLFSCFLRVCQGTGILLLGLAQFFGQFVDLLIHSLLCFLQLIDSLTLRLTSFLRIWLIQLFLSFLHLAFSLF